MQFMVGIFRECYFVILVIIALLLIIPILFSKKINGYQRMTLKRKRKNLDQIVQTWSYRTFLFF